MKSALREGGIICTQVSIVMTHNKQGECQWLHLPLIKKVMDNAATLYSSVRYAYTTIPTYPCGQIGFIMAIKDRGRGSHLALLCRGRPDPSQPRDYGGNASKASILLEGDS